AHRKGRLPEDSLGEPLDSLAIELGRISAEIQSINSGFQVHMQQVLAETRSTFEKQFETRVDQCVDQLRDQMRVEIRTELETEFRKQTAERDAHLETVKRQIEKINSEIEAIGDEITKMLADPSVELSKVMRKHTKQAELKAYLDGLRFAIG